MRISNYPTDVLTGTELILATDIDVSNDKYKTVNFSVDTLKTFLTTDANNGVTSIVFEGAADDAHEGSLTSNAASSDKTYTLPNATGFVALYTADPLGVTIDATPAELNIMDGVTSTTAELNILDGVTATAAEINYLDITTLGTGQASKAVTASAGNVVKLTGELQVSYVSPRIVLEDTNTSKADVMIHALNDLFRIDTKANGGSYVNAFSIDGSSATPIVTCVNGISVSSATGNIAMNGGNITNAQMVDTNVLNFAVQTGAVSSGAINQTDTITKLSTGGSAGATSLADPSADESLMKMLVFETDGGGDMVTSVTSAGWKSGGAAGTITFDTIGDSCTLVYSGNAWFAVGNNGCTFA